MIVRDIKCSRKKEEWLEEEEKRPRLPGHNRFGKLSPADALGAREADALEC